MTVRVAMWSGPRNISTAMMRSWENRPDTVVVDEPLYAAYLHRTGLDHPGRDEVLASQSSDPDVVVAQLLAPVPDGTTVHYSKQMTHHLDAGVDHAWVGAFRNVLLIREPREVVASYVRSREACEPDDLGLLQQVPLHDELLTRTGGDAPVIDAADFLRSPEAHLRWLCDWLEIPFTDAMLHWPAGPRDSDGVWAPHWYDAVWASTGFAPYRPRHVELSAHDEAVAAACRPAYETLAGRRLLLD
ncbi:HAD family hydrolase [Nocardioides sp.]|uniref:sulfotransferase-like domain-containing protein n=1 Tax=Nocardioides sp. TaxID=35761 RepID=UPI0035270468